MSEKTHHRRSRPSHRQAGKVRWCSFLWIATAAAFLAGLGTMGYGFFNREIFTVKIGLMMLASTLIFFGISLLSSAGLNCAICANPVFSSRPCKKHARATRFLGISYRLGIAIPALFTSRFRCMYCGEKMTLSAAKQAQKGVSVIKPRSDRPICSPGTLPSVRSTEQLRGLSVTTKK